MSLIRWMISFGVLALGLCAQTQQSPQPAKPGASSRIPTLRMVEPESGVQIKSWQPPEYTPELLAEKVEGQVNLLFYVDVDDSIKDIRVRNSSDPRLNAIAIATLKKWEFLCAVENGTPVPADLMMPIVFRLNQPPPDKRPLQPPVQPRYLPRTKAKGKVMPMPNYPEEMEAIGIPGSIQFQLEVTEEGRASNPRVLFATHPAFVRPGLECLLNDWRFEPQLQGRFPRRELVRVPMEYDFPMSSRKDLLERNGICGAGGAALRDGNGIPLLEGWYAPVYPFDALIAGKSGKATVEFTVDGGGMVSEILSTEASEPAFGGALRAAVVLWRFKPVISDGKGVSTTLRAVYSFTPPPPEDKASPNARLIAALKGPEGIPIASEAKLDEKLRPLYRMSPLNPSKTELTEKIQIEVVFVIDREGRARLPTFDASKNEEFGWAAAQALAQWVFAPPMKEGKPIDVRVKLPFSFEL